MTKRGGIEFEKAYRLAKMLDHSDWNLPRKISPCDFDMVLDNDGAMIFIELETEFREWRHIAKGQRLAYQSAIRLRPHCAALCKHSVRPEDERLIRTLNDIESFQIMIHDGRAPIFMPVVHGANLWGRFVDRWFEDAVKARVSCLRAAQNDSEKGEST